MGLRHHPSDQSLIHLVQERVAADLNITNKSIKQPASTICVIQSGDPYQFCISYWVFQHLVR